MKLNQLFSFFQPASQIASKSANAVYDAEVSGIFFNARNVQPNSVFVAINGTKSDGHEYVPQAIEAGAIALVVENKSKVPEDFPGVVLVVPSTRHMLDLLAARFYSYPSEQLFCIGVTGTNGKTSVTYLLEHILNHNNRRAGVMGTVNHRVGDMVWDSQMTTPDPVTLQSRLRDFIDEGAVAAVMEVSSHALDQKRADSVHFNTVIFTNLTLDHLDYHKTMREYFFAKSRLFTDLLWISTKSPLFAIINVDDPYGRQLQVAGPAIIWTYGKTESDFQFKIKKMNFSETEFEIKTTLESIQVRLPITGEHMIYNVVAAVIAALSSGITLENSFKALESFQGVPGRLQRVGNQFNKTVFVDYAHTPDALENVLRSLHEVQKKAARGSKIITVFGCGGDRDKSKRPLMGKIAVKYSDLVIITSDNPRTEPPEKIIDDILAGLNEHKKNYSTQIDRELAIAEAISQASENDVVLIAGKGHEDYQIIGTEKKHFSDYEMAKMYLKENI